MSTHSQLLLEIEQMAGTATSAEKLMQEISDRLHAGLARYNWVGFYLVDRKNQECWLWVRTREALCRTRGFLSGRECAARPRQAERRWSRITLPESRITFPVRKW